MLIIMDKILYAQPVIDKEIQALIEKCNRFKSKGINPCLKVLLIGEDESSKVYTKNKKNFCEKIGASCEIIKMKDNTTEKDFLAKVEQLNNDMNVHGVIIQLPLPKQLSHIDTTDLITPNKDIDGFHSENIAALFRGKPKLVPCTPLGIKTMADYYGIDFSKKRVAIIGRSLIVGKPLSLLLTNLNATVTLAHSHSENIKQITQSADIIVTATGTPKFFNADYFRNDQSQIVFDVGISYADDAGLSGDCDFDAVSNMVKAITPVPKGIGPMTIFSVAQNLLHALENSL